MSSITFPQSRFQDDLRGLIDGEVLCDDVTLQLYSTDASHFTCRPYGVVFPRSTEDVVTTVKYASEHELPLHPRGSGTGRAGGCLGHGIVLDMTRYMRRIIHSTEETAVIQTGAFLDRVNRTLTRSQGRIIGPNPGFAATTTLGSILASNGAGPHWLKYGFPHQSVRKLQVVLASGETLTVRSSDVPAGIHHGKVEQEVHQILSRLPHPLLQIQSDRFPDRAGYRIHGVLHEERVNLIPLLTGSEGTLGIITEVEMATVSAPKQFGMAMFLFDSLDKAMRAVPLILAGSPNYCELIDRRQLSLLRDWDKRCQSLVPVEAEAILVVGIDGVDSREVGDHLHEMVDTVRHEERLCMTTRVALHPMELHLFRELLSKAKWSLSRMPHYFHGLSLFEDTAFPTDLLPSYIVAVQNLFKRHEQTPSFFGHVGHGQVSVQPVFDISSEDAISRMGQLAPEFYDLVFEHRGTISSEQVCGFARTPMLTKQHQLLTPVFEQIKKVFDPTGILNPGKVVPSENSTVSEYRRPMIQKASVERQETPGRRQMELQLKWDSKPIEETTLRCNGCGRCRSRTSDMRMCPVFRHQLNEEAAPRAKANVLRGVIDSSMDLQALTTDVSKTVADHCLHCHLCRSECPAEVDIPRLTFQIKSAHVAAHGLTLSDRFFSHIDQILRFASLVSCPVNWSLKNRLTRWIYEKAFSISQERKLPKLSKISFLSRTLWYKRLARPSRRREQKVALFIDTFANHFDPKLADAAIKVLEHNGVDVYVPGRQVASGISSITCGHFDRAEKLARHNITLFADVIRQGYQIVTLEPTSALCLREEYRYMVDDPETAVVAAGTVDLCQYLYQLHLNSKLQLDFSPLHTTVGYHAPCRTLAMSSGPVSAPTAAERLLRLIPGLGVKRLERGCCGLSWNYGLKKENYRMSLRIGLPLFSALRDPLLLVGATECSACKMQMEQGVNKNTVHPIKFLALAYGLMPEIAPLLLPSTKKTP